MKRLLNLGRALNRQEQVKIVGGDEYFSDCTANCSSGSVFISNCNGTCKCKDFVGCKCTGTTDTYKCCNGASTCTIE